MSFIDYYKVFGLEPRATLSQIREKYHELILLYHPDKRHETFPESIFDFDFISIQQAWSILRDPKSRTEYDERREKALSKMSFKMASSQIDLDDMEMIENESFFQSPCRCGYTYQITISDMEKGSTMAYCSGCSLSVEVLYQIE